jgi:hypothetical protein
MVSFLGGPNHVWTPALLAKFRCVKSLPPMTSGAGQAPEGWRGGELGGAGRGN